MNPRNLFIKVSVSVFIVILTVLFISYFFLRDRTNSKYFGYSGSCRSGTGLQLILTFDSKTQEETVKQMIKDLKIKRGAIASQRKTAGNGLVLFSYSGKPYDKQLSEKSDENLLYFLKTQIDNNRLKNWSRTSQVLSLTFPVEPSPEEISQMKLQIEENSNYVLLPISQEEADKRSFLKLLISMDTKDRDFFEKQSSMLQSKIRLYPGVTITDVSSDTWFNPCL